MRFRFSLLLAMFLLVVMPSAVEAGNLNACIAGLWPAAQAKGVSRQTFNAAMAGVTRDDRVLEAARRQPEFTKTIGEYLETAISEKRLKNGLEMKRKHARLLDKIEARYGVSKYVVLAIWGMESSYGQVLEDPKIVKSTIRSLTTLACADKRRRRFGRSQLVAALQILQRGDTTPRRMTGSWAGAMGHTQFIPTTYNAYAVDFTGDGKRDIWTTIPDALASTANYLKKAGWQTGKTWGYEVRLPRGFDYANIGRKRSIGEWERIGVRRSGGRSFPRPGDEATLKLPSGGRGPAFLILRNFRAILRYNNADAYAFGVGHLADRIAGGAPFEGTWPKDDRPLTFSQRKELQTILSRRGFSTGGIDGKVGPKTLGAIRSFQRSAGLIPDGYAGQSLLTRLRSGS